MVYRTIVGGFVLSILLLPVRPIGAQDALATQAARAERHAPASSLLEADRAWSRRCAESGLVALAPALAEDAYYLATGREIIRGREPVVAALRSDTVAGGAPRHVAWQAVRATVSGDGSLGYSYGYFDSAERQGGASSHGKYIAVWRALGGEWKVLALLLSPGAGEERSRGPAEAAVSPGIAGRSNDAFAGGADEARRGAMAADSAFARFASTDGVRDAFAHYAAPDAAILSGGPRIIFGRDSIVAAYGHIPAGARLVWAPVSAQAATSGDLAFTVGNAVFTLPDAAGARTSESHSKYLTVWRRQPDGRWRYVVDGGNARPAR